ncbi:heat-inducible transcriptional repressor HrcA [Clostridium thermarum]|uniref:heat-inducible transcriptional repressor HrcA n=1 Tax=Clostridium thermarum TaxID=1716543 RepID=UPI00112132A5|nr:heat-inducible transcriptional repressor HrcA [Clostridium thermarum]
MEFDDRKLKILHAIINDYISTGEPVGSRTIARKYDLGVSSATIRNEMADLEEMGYIEQLHTSSGRKPSDKGYRLYVDKLMKAHQITAEEELFIRSMLLNAALFEVDKIMRQVSVVLSKLTHLTCVVKTPSVKKSCLKTIQLINIDVGSILMVIVTDSGIIKNNIIRINRPIDSDMLLKLNNMLNARLKNLTMEGINLEVINNIKKDLHGYDDIFNEMIPALYDCLNEVENSDVITEGETNILRYAEYSDIDKAKEFITFVDNKESVKKILPATKNTTVSIGEENYIPEAKDYSVVARAYCVGDKPLGTIGIIGPTRMDYSKVISLLNKVTELLNKNLTSFDDW